MTERASTLYLLRHVKAGDRRKWEGDDRERPASAPGVRQAEAVVEQYADLPIIRIVSSPYLRCVQSVEPLARARGLPVVESDHLGEGTPADLVVAALATVGDGTVWCTHGDVGEWLLAHAEARGVDVGAAPFAKGSTWVMDLSGGVVVSAHYLPPP